MNWRLGLGALAAIPFLALAFWSLTRILPPLAGYFIALAIYWLGLALVVLREIEPAERLRLLALVRPGAVLSLLLFLPVLIAAWSAIGWLQVVVLPAGLLLVIAAMALVNGLLEELFWRGALLQRPDGLPSDREGVITAWGLFTTWHLALLFATGVALPGGPLMFLIAAALLGALWMAARLRTGTLGAAVASHVALNLFVFTELVAVNWG